MLAELSLLNLPLSCPTDPHQNLRENTSLTQFYSVIFSQSRWSVKKCVFGKRTIKVCVRSFWALPCLADLSVSLCLCSLGSNARGESSTLEGFLPCQLKKTLQGALQGSKTEKRKLLEVGIVPCAVMAFLHDVSKSNFGVLSDFLVRNDPPSTWSLSSSSLAWISEVSWRFRAKIWRISPQKLKKS